MSFLYIEIFAWISSYGLNHLNNNGGLAISIPPKYPFVWRECVYILVLS